MAFQPGWMRTHLSTSRSALTSSSDGCEVATLMGRGVPSPLESRRSADHDDPVGGYPLGFLITLMPNTNDVLRSPDSVAPMLWPSDVYADSSKCVCSMDLGNTANT